MMTIQAAKDLVWQYNTDFDLADADCVAEVLQKYTTADYNWKGVYPFREISDRDRVVSEFWQPLKRAIKHLQRRPDIFIGGHNSIDGDTDAVWVMNMGHLMGLFDEPWLGLPPTSRMLNIRYAEFHRVKNGKITHTGLFIDLIGVMQQAGLYPLPPSTGHYFVYPGPREHNGIVRGISEAAEGEKTLAVLNTMIDDLDKLNKSGAMDCPPDVLRKAWDEDMVWYGPCGIGASYTIVRYQLQHQLPFRNNLGDKRYNGHVCRFADGQFACFFGWPNLTNTALGGFLGLPGSGKPADMQVVDVYYRRDDKLTENWVLIDIPWWLKQQGLDVLQRTTTI